MNEMVEKVAQSIFQLDFPNCSLIDFGHDYIKRYHNYAKNAIQAMREPSVPMIDAAIRYGVDFDMGVNYDIYEEMYQKMIDEALK